MNFSAERHHLGRGNMIPFPPQAYTTIYIHTCMESTPINMGYTLFHDPLYKICTMGSAYIKPNLGLKHSPHDTCL